MPTGMGALDPFGCKQSTLPDLLRLDSPDLAMRVHIRFYSPLLRQSQSVFQQPLAEREAVLPHGTYVLEGNVDTQARAVGLGARPLCTGCIRIGGSEHRQSTRTGWAGGDRRGGMSHEATQRNR